MKLYENVFVSKGRLYTREYDTETKKSEIKYVNYIPSLFIPTNEESKYYSILTDKPLKKVDFKSNKEYKDTLKMYQNTNINVHGLKDVAHNYIRETYGEPTENDHEFRIMYLDIETAILDKDIPKHITRYDWKPEGLRAAMATITSIQMYDTFTKKFIILGLKKNWENKSNFKSEYGDIHYIKCDTEAILLKKFIEILHKINPTVIAGWNSEAYDYPYITLRVARVLDNNQDIFIEENKQLVFNKDILNGSYVKQLSPVNEVRYRAKDTQFGIVHTFQWIGYILEDYQDLFKKYTYEKLISYSLQVVSEHILGEGKVEHDEFTDFAEFYNKDFDNFIKYGIKDIELLHQLNLVLKLIDLAKYIAYICGVTMNDVRGTLKQWMTFVYNEAYKDGAILPLKNNFDRTDTTLLEEAIKMDFLSKERKDYYKSLYEYRDEKGQYTLRGQTFPGGWTIATSKFWKWVFSLDFTSLYPSAQMWANIGIDTLILPKDLPRELLELRAKYFNFYPKNVEPNELKQFDFEFITNVLENKEVREEIEKTLKKYDVCATPNGMFFKRSKQSTMSKIIEKLIVKRKEFKKRMKEVEQEIENLKLSDNIDNEKIFKLKQELELFNIRQMGVKIGIKRSA